MTRRPFRCRVGLHSWLPRFLWSGDYVWGLIEYCRRCPAERWVESP